MGPTQLETGGANTPVRAVVVAKRPEYGLHVRFISTNSVCSISVSIYHSYVDTLQYLSHSKCICGWFIILCHIDLHIYIYIYIDRYRPYSYMVHIDRYRYFILFPPISSSTDRSPEPRHWSSDVHLPRCCSAFSSVGFCELVLSWEKWLNTMIHH